MNNEKKAILLVTFGTNVSRAAEVFANIENRVRSEFPGIEVRWSYTAKTIRKALSKKGQTIDSPITALAKLQDEGYTQVAVQSVHILPGQEFYDLVNVVDHMSRFHGSSGKHFQTRIGKFGFERLTLGTPLLYQQEDYQAVLEVLKPYVPQDKNHALVLVGHGSGHHTFSVYGCLNDMLRQTYGNVFLGTVEGYPSLEEVRTDLVRYACSKITLMPFMNIAGDHALVDIAGDEPDSWKNQLAIHSTVHVDLTALLELEGILDIYLQHLHYAFERLAESTPID